MIIVASLYVESAGVSGVSTTEKYKETKQCSFQIAFGTMPGNRLWDITWSVDATLDLQCLRGIIYSVVVEGSVIRTQLHRAGSRSPGALLAQR